MKVPTGFAAARGSAMPVAVGRRFAAFGLPATATAASVFALFSREEKENEK